MKSILVLLSATLLLSACTSSATRKAEADAATAANNALAARRAAISAAAHAELRAGISSATVEKLAKARNPGCADSDGAALVGDAGPVESYRMVCSNGQVIMAKCELRQCKLVSQ